MGVNSAHWLVQEDQSAEQFRFLSEAEFLALGANDRLKYLIEAGAELERRRQKAANLTEPHAKQRSGE